MKIKLFIERENSKKTISFSGKNVSDFLKHIKLNPEPLIVTRKNEVLTLDDKIKNNDLIEILSVVSGG